jgi:DUF4097 and DUF4098 domain-containing protein YvlB
MRKISSSLFLLLITLATIILTMTACSSGTYETNVHAVNAEFEHISIKTDTANIAFLPSDDGMCRVVCHEEEKKKHSVEVKDGTLTVEVVNDKEWYDYIGINIDSPKVTIYLPEAKYSSLVIEGSTGDIEVSKNFEFKSIYISLSTGNVNCYASTLEDIKIVSSTGNVCAESLSASAIDIIVSTGEVTVLDIMCDGDVTIGVSTGDAHLTNVVCKNLISTGSTGNISLKSVICKENISIERSTGDITLENSDAAELFITTDTGNVTGSLLTDKVFILKTNTGRIDVPDSIIGGKCKITTDTGDIKISISDN